MKLSHLAFCVVAVGLTYAIAAFAFPLVAKDISDIEAAQIPLSAELFDDLDLGEFGVVPVLDIVQHYIDNPPVAADPASAAKKVRFQGC